MLLYHFNCNKQLEFFYEIKSITVGSVGEAVGKTSFCVLRSTKKLLKTFLKGKIQTKQTTGGSRENIDSYNEYRVNE